MGSRLSSTAGGATTTGQTPAAKVINSDGSLIEYFHPVTVSHILGLNHSTFVLCNADELIYGHHIKALEADHLIELGKLYFFLPARRVCHVLTAPEMAALAVRANSAFASTALMLKKKRTRWRRRDVQVMPVVMGMECGGFESFNESSVGGWMTERGGGKSDGVMQRGLSRREGAVKRSFRPRLDSIQEVCE